MTVSGKGNEEIDPTKWGWKAVKNKLTEVTNENKLAPDQLLRVIWCNGTVIQNVYQVDVHVVSIVLNAHICVGNARVFAASIHLRMKI